LTLEDMMKRFRSLAAQSPALVISIAALFFSLGSGAGYAATVAQHHSQPAASAHVVSTPAVLPQARVAWTNFALLNGWVVGCCSSGTPAWGVNGTGILYLRGAARTVGTNELLAVLPAGNRPSHYLYLPVYTDGSTEGSIEIWPNGDIYAYGDTTPEFDYLSLNGISFVIGA